MAGLKTIGLPHGANLVSGRLRSTADLRRGSIGDYSSAWTFDAVVVQNRAHTEYLMEGGARPDIFHILGSARFCPEWMSILLPLTMESAARLDSSSGCLKVLYIDKPFGTLADELEKTISRLSQLDFIDLVVKPPTRNNRGTIVFDDSKIHVDTQTPTGVLVSWADVVVGVVSSILLEVLVQGKPLLYPKFLNPTPTMFEDFCAVWVIDDPDSLESALRMLHADRGKAPDLTEGRDRLLLELVYGGRQDRDVLGDYADLIVSLSRSSGKAAENPIAAIR